MPTRDDCIRAMSAAGVDAARAASLKAIVVLSSKLPR